MNWPPIYADAHRSQRQHLQSGGGDNNVGLEFLPRLQPDAVLRKSLDFVGHDRSPPFTDCLEQVRVENQAQALISGLIARIEMLIHVVSCGKAFRLSLAKHTAHVEGCTAA